MKLRPRHGVSEEDESKEKIEEEEEKEDGL